MAMLVDNQKMMEVKASIEEKAAKFGSTGSAFIETLTNTLDTFEGETKDILMSKKIGSSGAEVEGTLAYFVEKQIPECLNGLANLLEGNRSTIEDCDRKLADAISGSGQG